MASRQLAFHADRLDAIGASHDIDFDYSARRTIREPGNA